MRGNRFKPLTWETMTLAQVALADKVLAGQRGSMQGPYNVLLHSPALGDLAQQFGAHTRFHSSLPLKLNEMAILLVARFWRCEFVWWIHRQIALENGLSRALVDSILERNSPTELSPEEAVVFAFCNELILNRRVSDASYKGLVEVFGQHGAVDLMGTMSYYTLVSMALNVDQYPLPEGARVEFPAERV